MSKGKGEVPARWQEGQNCILNQTPYPPEMLRGLKQTLCTQGPRDPTETETELCLSVDCCRGRGFGCSRPGYGIRPLGGGCHWLHYRAARPYIGLEKQTLGGHIQNLVHTRTQEKGVVTPQETNPDLPVISRSLRWGVGGRWPAAVLGALNAAVQAWDLLKEVAIIFITSTIAWPQVK